jgi:predicted transcriptional regulator
MANTKSITKVLDYLKTKHEAVSPSELVSEVNLKWTTIKEVLEILKMNNQVLILTTGKSSLVQFKRCENANK